MMMTSRQPATPTQYVFLQKQNSSRIMSLFRKLGLVKRQQPLLQYKVTLSDGTERQFELESRATGTVLLEASLLSMSIPSLYHELFGLAVTSREQGMEIRWVRLQKPIRKEVKGLPAPISLQLRMLLYPRDHRSIVHPVAKHLMYSQVRQDLKAGRLKCNSSAAAKLAGLVAQAELGDFSLSLLTRRYISQLQALPQLSVEQERAAIEQHKLRRGMMLEECVEEFLSIGQSVTSYGTLTCNVQDSSNWAAVLAYGPTGVQVLMGGIQTVLLEWESIVRINVRNRYLTFHTENSYNYSTSAHSFRCPTSKHCRKTASLCIIMRNHYCESESFKPQSRFRRFLSRRGSQRQQNSKLLSNRLTTPPRSFSMSRVHTRSSSFPSITATQSPRRQSDSEQPRKQLLTTADERDSPITSTPVLPTLVKANTLPARIGSMASPPNSPLPPPELAASMQTIHSHPLPSPPMLADSDHDTHSPPTPPPHRRNPQLNRSTGDVSRFHSDGREGSRYHHSYKRQIQIGRNSVGTENSGLEGSHPRPTWRRYDHRLSIPTLSNEFYQQSHTHSKSHSNIHRRQRYTSSNPRPAYHSSLQRLTPACSRESVATIEHQMGLAGLSQGSATGSHIDPHIFSLVFQSSQADTATVL